MKRFSAILLGVFLCVSAIFVCACGKTDNGEIAKDKTVYVKYAADASEILPLMKKGELKVALLPEPAASKLETALAPEKTWYRLDLQELYDNETKAYPQAVMMIKSALLNAYPNIAKTVADGFDANAEWVKNNTADAVKAINEHLEEGVTPSLTANAITSAVVENCKIYWQNATSAKKDVNAYISAITSIDAAAAKTTGEEFYADYKTEAEKTWTADATVHVVVPDGAPALAIAKYINDNYDFGTGLNFEYKVVNSSKIGAAMQQGSAEIVIIPVNAASKLYKVHAEDPYQLLGVVTHGNLYIVSDERLTVSDLDGKEVGVIGLGLVPDLTFKAVLAKYDIKIGNK